MELSRLFRNTAMWWLDRRAPKRTSREPLHGWRSFRLDYDAHGPILVSPVKRTAWDGPLSVADRPPRFVEDTPAGRGHGIYAAKLYPTQSHVDEWVAEVELSGRVVVHETGYRAERAVITKLYFSPVSQQPFSTILFTLSMGGGQTYRYGKKGPPTRVTESLGARYGCEVDATTFREWTEAHEKGPAPDEPVSFEFSMPTPMNIQWGFDPAASPDEGIPTIHKPTEEETRWISESHRKS